jgi:hypothetical protein
VDGNRLFVLFLWAAIKEKAEYPSSVIVLVLLLWTATLMAASMDGHDKAIEE